MTTSNTSQPQYQTEPAAVTQLSDEEQKLVERIDQEHANRPIASLAITSRLLTLALYIGNL